MTPCLSSCRRVRLKCASTCVIKRLMHMHTHTYSQIWHLSYASTQEQVQAFMQTLPATVRLGITPRSVADAASESMYMHTQLSRMAQAHMHGYMHGYMHLNMELAIDS